MLQRIKLIHSRLVKYDTKSEELISIRKEFLEKLRSLGFQERCNIDMNSNSQFASISDQLRNDAHQHDIIRKRAVDWLRKCGRDTLLDFLDKEKFASFDDYCDYMSKPETHGDDLTLRALVEVYKVRLFVVSTNIQGKDPSFVDFSPKEKPEIIIIIYQYGNYYGSLTYSNTS